MEYAKYHNKITLVGAAVLGGMITANATFAQVPPPMPAPQEFTLHVTGADVTTIGEGLGMLPYSKVAPLMQKLQNQINEQQPKPPVPPSPDAVKKKE